MATVTTIHPKADDIIRAIRLDSGTAWIDVGGIAVFVTAEIAERIASACHHAIYLIQNGQVSK